MRNYYFSRKALSDISKIYKYTYLQWSESQADKYYKFLIDYCILISNNPHLGKKYDKIIPGLLGYHTKHHIIFYNIINENKIEIIRILGREMDLKNRLKKDNQ